MLKIKSIQKLAQSLIALSFLSTWTNAYATCNSNVTNTSNSSTSTLSSSGTGDCIENAGTILTNSTQAHGIISSGDNTTNRNSGTIITNGNWSHGFYIPTGVASLNLNSGTITLNSNYSSAIVSNGLNSININSENAAIRTYGLHGYGIESYGIGSTNTNSGTITTSGDYGRGIYSGGPSSTNTNSGTITTSGDYGGGVYSVGTSSTNTNSGSISTLGYNGVGMGSYGDNSTVTNSNIITTIGQYGYGLGATGNSNTLINIGKIQTQGLSGAGLIFDSQYGGNNVRIINIGQITTTNTSGYGIYSTGNNAHISNSGLIETSGDSAHGIAIANSTSAALDNSGIIKVTRSNSTAIYIDSSASDITVNLNKGSVIVGDIYARTGTTGAKLNMNLGAGASYAYSVTGPWTVSDLDNRPMITGSAYAAGIGAQETASQMLYQRTSSITSALDRRLRSYASDEVDNQPYWLDVYYSDVTRNAGGNYSTQTAFSNYNYGITAGFKLPAQFTPLELVVNVEQSNLNIDSGNQKIDSSSIMAGLLAPNVTDVLGAKLSAKALMGYADHNGDRKVMTNSLLYDGSRQIKSDYNSTFAVLGTALTKLYSINDRLTADVVLGLDLNVQRTESYKETDYFAWDSRTLTQLHSRIQTGLDYKLWGDKGSVFARVGAEHRDLIGGATQDYSINGTNVSFNTNNKNDTYLTAQVGIKAQLEKRIQLFGILNTMHSSDSVNSVSGNIGLRADF